MSRRNHSGARRLLKAVKPDSPTKWGLYGAAAAGGAVAISQISEGPANLFAYVVAAVAESPAWVIAGTAALGSAAAFFLADATTAAVQTCGPRDCRKEVVKHSDVDAQYTAFVPQDWLGQEVPQKSIGNRCGSFWDALSAVWQFVTKTPTRAGVTAGLLVGAGIGFSGSPLFKAPFHAYQEFWAMLAGANITQSGNQTVITFANQTMAAGSQTPTVWAFTSINSALMAFEAAVLIAAFLMTCASRCCRREYVDARPELLTGSYATSVNKDNTRLNPAPGKVDVDTSGDEVPPGRSLGYGYGDSDQDV